jgi:hypothetical protein
MAHDDDMTSTMERRASEYTRLAHTIMPLLNESPNPTKTLAELLMDCYRDGARDMHAAVTDILTPHIEGIEEAANELRR